MSPLVAIAALTALRKTGPAVFALLVLRAFRAPKGVLSLSIPLFSFYHVAISRRDMVNENKCY